MTDSPTPAADNATAPAPVADAVVHDLSSMTIGVLGGTGEQGRGLATRWARAGLSVVIGSRSAERAQAVADEIGGDVRGDDNAGCARSCDIVVVAVPWDGHGELLESLADDLADTIVVDCVNPLGFDKQGAFALDVAEGSAMQQAAALLPRSTVVGAFHHVSAVVLLDPAVTTIDTDILVIGDDRAATNVVSELASRIEGMRGIYGGRLRNGRQVEAWTANLISINRRYKAHAGVRITDV